MLKRKFVAYVFLSIISVGYLPGQGLAATAAPKAKIIVAKSGGNYTTVTAALNAITPGVTNPYIIEVWPGTYVENIVMKNYVALQGSGRDVTTIKAASTTTPTLTINTSNVMVSGFTLSNTIVNDAVVYIKGNDVVLRDNTVTNNNTMNGAGIYIQSGDPILVSGNKISDGLGFYGGSPVISDNIISNNNQSAGIACWYGKNAVIADNKIYGNTYGISCGTNESITIIGNAISQNSNDGIYTYQTEGVISSNKINGNGGSGISASGATLAISENTITNNANNGLFAQGANIRVLHNGVTGNGGGIYSDVQAGSPDTNFSFNIFDSITGSTVGKYNLKSDGTPWP
ncbi:MAG: pectinesterase family protein [Gallionellaceae bacterium]|nr:pectinesterase family protein [Gallionellaceae bacterium]